MSRFLRLHFLCGHYSSVIDVMSLTQTLIVQVSFIETKIIVCVPLNDINNHVFIILMLTLVVSLPPMRLDDVLHGSLINLKKY